MGVLDSLNTLWAIVCALPRVCNCSFSCGGTIGVGKLSCARLLVVAAAGLVMAAGLSGCYSIKTSGPAPTFAATPDYRYVIGTGDSISVMVWRNPELSMGVPVRPDGRVTMPLSKISSRWAERRRNWRVTSSGNCPATSATRIRHGHCLRCAGPFSEQIRIIGEAASPQALPYGRT